ncbi:MAG: hypothetical protein ABSB71_08905 [Candidatus Bathyarchaeia archaeon]
MSAQKCPICGGNINVCKLDNANLSFLEACTDNGKLNAAISVARIVWNNFPELRLTADSKAIIEGLSVSMREDLQKQVTDILRPIEVFTRNFPELIEKLPEDVRKDLQREFQETKTALEAEFSLLRESVLNFKNVFSILQNMGENIESTTKKEIETVKQDLTSKFRETLEKMGFPQPEQMRLLSQLVPSILPLLEELVRFQKSPVDKGRQGETELLKELNDYFPEDEHVPLGMSGDTDILTKPKYNGANIDWRIIIESKKNNSGWSRSFLQEVKRHMKMRGERLCLLTVEVMPKGSNGFIIETCSEGVILVTSRDNFRVAYGALRAVLIALIPFNGKQVDIRKILEDRKIEELINEAFQYNEFLKNIRRESQKILTCAKNTIQNADDLDNCLKQSLKELQQRMKLTIEAIG